MRIIKPYFEVETPLDYEQMVKHIEKCGKTCYKSELGKEQIKAENFIKGIINSGHESVLEHQSITVRLITSRSVTHQLVRHRIASYSQESQRYCSYDKEKFGSSIIFIKPTWVDDIVCGDWNIKWNGLYGSDVGIENKIDKATNRWFWNCAISERDYFRLINEGWKAEQAREVLTNSAKTEIVFTMNIRELRSMFNLRCEKHAQTEIRYVMIKLLKYLQNELPIFFVDIKYDLDGLNDVI